MRFVSALLVLIVPAAAAAEPEVIVGFEAGPTYVAQNDGRYGAGGTAYDADDVGQRDTLAVARRTTAELRLDRHAIIALYAPFRLDTRVALAEDLRFRDAAFAAGTVV